MKAIFSFIWGAIRAFTTVAAFIFFILVFVIIVGISGDGQRVEVPQGGAFVFNPVGQIVDQKKIPTINDVLSGAKPVEVKLRDAMKAVKAAKDDDKIALMVMDLDKFTGAGPAVLHELGGALESFRKSGKKIIAVGDSFGQPQYYLAAHADEIWLNPAGDVGIMGYGAYGPYFSDALDKLKADVHVFRVGTYKSAVEPFIRNDMSDAAKEATKGFLDSLWGNYLADVTRLRGFDEGALSAAIDGMVDNLRAADGDVSKMALDLGWVDALKTRSEMTAALVDLVGKADMGEGFKGIGLTDYLKQLRSHDKDDKDDRLVAVVSLRGAIVPGKAPVGQIGADTAVKLIKAARTNDKVKALVLRIDSPGGSVFASEVIRQAVLDVQKAGKPVIASYGTVAASGGYWISANADEIWAMPETITGSIGIFGMITTFDQSLDMLGVHTDGVGTTQLAGAFDLTRPLSPMVADLVQSSIEHGYGKFLSIVAEGRSMSVEAVDAIAQGRVWSGETAQELGLVDHLGGLDDAVKAAAQKAGLEEGDYGVRHVQEQLDPFENFIVSVLEQAQVRGMVPDSMGQTVPVVADIQGRFMTAMEELQWLKDPKGAYAICMHCKVN